MRCCTSVSTASAGLPPSRLPSPSAVPAGVPERERREPRRAHGGLARELGHGAIVPDDPEDVHALTSRQSGVQEPGQLLDTVDQPGARAGPRGVGVDGVRVRRAAARRCVTSSSAKAWLPARSKPHGATTTTSGVRACTSSQVTRRDFSPAVPSTARRRRASIISGIQWPGANGGSVHSRNITRGRARPGRGARPPPAGPLAGDEVGGLALVAGGLAEGLDRDEHLVEGVGVDGQHLGGAAQVGERVVDDRDVDGADGAQVLGDDQVGVEARPARPRRGGRGRRLAPSPRPRTRRSRPASALRASRSSTRSGGCGPRPGSRTRTSRPPRRRPPRSRTGSPSSTGGGTRCARLHRRGLESRRSDASTALTLASAWTTRRLPCWRCSRWRGWRRGSSTRWWAAVG